MCFKAKVFVSLDDQRNKMIPPLFSILRESMVTSFRDSETYRIVSLVFMIHGMCGWILGNEVVGGICQLIHIKSRKQTMVSIVVISLVLAYTIG